MERKLGIGIQVDKEQIKRELQALKDAVSNLLGSIGMSGSDLNTLVQNAKEMNSRLVAEAQDAAEKQKSIKTNLKAFYLAQDKDLLREEIEMAKRTGSELAAIQKARLAQAGQINKQMTAGGEYGWITGGMDQLSRQQLADFYKNASVEAEKLSKANQKVADSHANVIKANSNARASFLHLNEGISGVIKGAENLMAVQLRWYGAKAILFAAAELPVHAVKTAIEYAAIIDEWQAKLLRWGATGTHVTQDMKTEIKGLVDEMRKTTLEVPIPIDTLGKALDAFIGAGLPVDAVRGFTKEIGIMISSFPEIGVDKFATAIVGLFNVFKADMPGQSDAEKMKSIIAMLLKAQAEGVIRPENFTKIAQYMGEMGHVAGLSLEQVLALNVAITNTGVTAASSARLLASFIARLTETKSQAALTQLGISINPQQTFADQMMTTLSKLRDQLNAGGQTNMAAIGFVNQIAGKEGAKVLLPLLQQLQDIPALITRIANATGSWGDLNKLQTDSIKGKWQLIKNTMDEVSVASSSVSRGLSDIVQTMLEMAQGALYAVQPTLATAENMGKFGTAGKVAYDSMVGFKDITSEVFSALSPLKDLLKTTLDIMVEYRGVIALGIESWIAYKLAVIAFHGSLSLLSKILQGIELMEFLKIAGLLNPVLLAATVAAGGLGVAIYQIHKEAREATESLERLVEEAKKLPDIKLRIKVNTMALDIADVEREVEANKNSASNEQMQRLNKLKTMKAEYDAVQRELSTRKGTMAYEVPGMYPQASTPPPSKKGGPSNFPEKSGANRSAGTEISAAKELANALLAIEESYRKTSLAYKQADYKLGLLTDQEFYQIELDEIQKSRDAKLKVLDQEEADLKASYAKKRGETKDKGQQSAISEKEEAELKKIEARRVEIVNDGARQVLAKYTDLELKKRQIMLNGLQTELDIMKTRNQLAIDLLQSSLSTQADIYSFLYQSGGVGADQFYGQELARSKALTDANRKKLEDEYNKKVENLSKEQDLYVEGTNQWIKNQEDLKKLREQYLSEDTRLVDQNAKEQVQILLKAANDIKAIYSADGIPGAVKKGLKDMAAEWQNMGQLTVDAVKSIGQGGQQALSDFLYDIGDLKNASEYITSFANSAKRAFSDLLSKMVTGNLMNFFKDLLPQGTFEQFAAGANTTTASLMVQIPIVQELAAAYLELAAAMKIAGMLGGTGSEGTYLSGMPADASYFPAFRYHTGGIAGIDHPTWRPLLQSTLERARRYHLGSDEVPAILQRGETVFTAAQTRAIGNAVGSGKPNVNIQITPPQGMTMQQESMDVQFDGMQWWVKTAFKAVRSSPAVRNLFKTDGGF